MKPTLKKITCPRCGKEDTWSPDNPFRPFCSKRCKLIDLGEWAEGKNRVPGDPVKLNEPPENEDEEK